MTPQQLTRCILFFSSDYWCRNPWFRVFLPLCAGYTRGRVAVTSWGDGGRGHSTGRAAGIFGPAVEKAGRGDRYSNGEGGPSRLAQLARYVSGGVVAIPERRGDGAAPKRWGAVCECKRRAGDGGCFEVYRYAVNL